MNKCNVLSLNFNLYIKQCISLLTDDDTKTVFKYRVTYTPCNTNPCNTKFNVMFESFNYFVGKPSLTVTYKKTHDERIERSN